ncbi:hypothetical protein LDVICp129 [lymphocystis disease virus-China]|uniref:Uncharacterized protein n=2 Tax=Lymphocystis disease virus 2 TaxID=159183 RepID=A0A6F8X2J7_9VIRU|nr:hypothetical protein LDVICp129 [lymphocystis disease virus-China]AAU10974.1 hypothetical protein [lymphocystis disease virus-China]BCB67486.1 hypothetical protein [Lymphocystis disease virus 2]
MNCIFCKPDKIIIYICKNCIKLPGTIYLIKGFIPELISRITTACEDQAFNSVYFFNQCIVTLRYLEKEILTEDVEIFKVKPADEYSKKETMLDLIALRRTILLIKYKHSEVVFKIKPELFKLASALKCYVYQKSLTFAGESTYDKILAKDMEFIWTS